MILGGKTDREIEIKVNPDGGWNGSGWKYVARYGETTACGDFQWAAVWRLKRAVKSAEKKAKKPKTIKKKVNW